MKTRKMLASLLALGMVVSGSAMTASAADSVSVTVGTVSASAGEKFSVDVSLAGVPSSGISTADFAIEFDSSVISITDVKLGAIADTGAAAAENAVVSGLSDTVFGWNVVGNELDLLWVTGLTDTKYWIQEDGVFATITGTVKTGVKDGASSALKVVPVGRASYPDTTTTNSAIAIGYNNASGAAVSYGTSLTAGAVSVGSVTGNLCGDSNDDGAVSIADVVLLARYVSQDDTLSASDMTAAGKANADVNLDSQIDSSDIAGISRYLAGFTTLPIKE